MLTSEVSNAQSLQKNNQMRTKGLPEKSKIADGRSQRERERERGSKTKRFSLAPARRASTHAPEKPGDNSRHASADAAEAFKTRTTSSKGIRRSADCKMPANDAHGKTSERDLRMHSDAPHVTLTDGR